MVDLESATYFGGWRPAAEDTFEAISPEHIVSQAERWLAPIFRPR
jgi:hypothetical protein